MYKKIIFLFLIIILAWIWKDYKKIDTSFVNQSSVTYSYDNLNSNILKGFHKYFNTNYENFLFKHIKKHSAYWNIEDKTKRDALKEYKYGKTEEIYTESNYQAANTGINWLRSHGNNSSNRFSSLTQINKSNAKNLKVAWTFKHDDFAGDIQANPIVVDGVIYTPIAGGYIAAIDGSSGKLLWRSQEFGHFVARRGLVYFKTEDGKHKLYFSNRERLICLDANTGKTVKNFGTNGQVRTGLNVMTPVIYKNNIVIVTWDHAVEVYDLYNGRKKWKLKYKKEINKRIGGKRYINNGYNPWGGISLDDSRGLLYLTTGNPHFYFDGTLRPGNNPMSNSVIAVDLNKKNIIWSFQETSHDIWNSDLPAPPVLTSIKIENKLIDVVLTPTKRANTLVLDRLSGNPIFDFRYRKVPISMIKGEKTSPYQPDLEIPEPFGKNEFFVDDLWSYDEKKLSKIKKKYENHKVGFYNTYELNKKNLQYNFNGGAEWMGASVNHLNQVMYVTSNNIPWETSLDQVDDNTSGIPSYTSNFTRALDEQGYPITKPPWGTLTALNLNNGKIIWQIPFGEYKELTAKGIENTGTENFGGVTGTEGNILIATGTLDKKIYIFDATNGDQIYSHELPFIGSAPPTTYITNGKQYIITHSTGGKSLTQGYPDLVDEGNVIVAFTLN